MAIRIAENTTFMKNPYRSAEFLQSAPTLAQCPTDQGAEVAFAGRSNAGKSSAINTLTGNKKMAKTSKTPGRTQLINLFSLDNERRIVDLPGYGYAKVPKAMKRQWDEHLSEYLYERKSLRGLVLLMDSRHPLQPFDTMMLEWAQDANMATHILLTKSDKLSKGPAKSTLLKVRAELKHMDNVSLQLFSSLKKQGVDELVERLNQWLYSADAPEPSSNDERL